MGWLNDRVAIVTEGGAGIGEAVVLQPASEGARVVVSGLEHDPIDDVVRTASGVGPGAVACAGDLEEYGRLDILVNNAATEADRMCRADARSLVLIARAALQSLRRSRGVLLSAGSTADVPGIPNTAIYGATKGFARGRRDDRRVDDRGTPCDGGGDRQRLRVPRERRGQLRDRGGLGGRRRHGHLPRLARSPR